MKHIKITDTRGDSLTCSLQSFIRENIECAADVVAQVEQLKLGESLTIGGGAEPELKLEVLQC